ncbi:hypothetical protein RSAG8_13446, partial [Rhizoctonia solani AG-8 WAC10335]
MSQQKHLARRVGTYASTCVSISHFQIHRSNQHRSILGAVLANSNVSAMSHWAETGSCVVGYLRKRHECTLFLSQTSGNHTLTFVM